MLQELIDTFEELKKRNILLIWEKAVLYLLNLMMRIFIT